MIIQEILDERFPTPAAAIAKYGSTELLIPIASEQKVRPPIGDWELDLISEIPRSLTLTKIRLSLKQFCSSKTSISWWQFVSLGEM